MAKRPRSGGAFERLKAAALVYPEAWEDHPWGETVIKVRGKIFLFLFEDEDGLRVSLKLPRSREFALEYPFTLWARQGRLGHLELCAQGKATPRCARSLARRELPRRGAEEAGDGASLEVTTRGVSRLGQVVELQSQVGPMTASRYTCRATKKNTLIGSGPTPAACHLRCRNIPDGLSGF